MCGGGVGGQDLVSFESVNEKRPTRESRNEEGVYPHPSTHFVHIFNDDTEHLSLGLNSSEANKKISSMLAAKSQTRFRLFLYKT